MRKDYKCKIKIKRNVNDRKLKVNQKAIIGSILSSIIVILFFSNVVWKVSVAGGSEEVQYKVKGLVEEFGLEQGNWIQRVEDISTLEREIMNQIDTVSFVGIEKQGVAFHITVEETSRPPLISQEDPTNIIAGKDGTIQKMLVTNGKPEVSIYDVVSENDLLVSGLLDEENEVWVKSEGEIIAEVWYELSLTISLADYQYNKLSDSNLHYGLNIFNRFDLTPFYNETHALTIEAKPIRFLHWDLPLQIIEYVEVEEEAQELSIDLKNDLEQIVSTHLKRELDPTIKVDSLKVLHEHKDNDKVRLEMFVKVLEDISIQQIIDQGD